MPFCPNCKEEYREGFTRCVDCQIDLVPELEAEPEVKQEIIESEADDPMQEFSQDDPLVFLCNCDAGIEADVVISVLKNAGIPAIKVQGGVGAYLSVLMGASNRGADLYVPASMLEQAKDFLDAPPTNPDWKNATIIPDDPAEHGHNKRMQLLLIIFWALPYLFLLFQLLKRFFAWCGLYIDLN